VAVRLSQVALRVRGVDLSALVGRVEARSRQGRAMVGIVGPPGAGKSTLAAALTQQLDGSAVVVPQDGFHLADAELARQGLLDRKGAPETFDGWGFAALLDRLRRRPDHVVYAPGFERTLEQPLAGAVPVSPEVDVVITEGSYLLLDRPEWRAVRAQLDEVWYVDLDPTLRTDRLVARHVAFGKAAAEAAVWVEEVDGPNARLVERSRNRAELLVDLTGWAAPATGDRRAPG
jgi:pantothenate kinase